jgi:hypothetical protein
MDKQREILEFVIDAYTPATIPMARLAEYMGQLATLLGEKASVHFVELKGGSTGLLHAVEPEATPKVRTTVNDVRAGGGPPESRRAYENIDVMLRADNAKGELRRAADKEPTGRLLAFPGASRHLEEPYGPFNEPGQLYGVPIGVGGKQALANVNLEDGERTYYCEATRDIAIQIAPLIYTHSIRVSGIGRYYRDVDGKWEMRGFRISHFEPLDARPLAETVERLRGITRKSGLDKDIIRKLAELREG